MAEQKADLVKAFFDNTDFYTSNNAIITLRKILVKAELQTLKNERKGYAN